MEEALKSYEGVADVAVVGVPDERFGQAIVAIVSVVPGADFPGDEALAAHVRGNLAATKSLGASNLSTRFLEVQAENSTIRRSARRSPGSQTPVLRRARNERKRAIWR